MSFRTRYPSRMVLLYSLTPSGGYNVVPELASYFPFIQLGAVYNVSIGTFPLETALLTRWSRFSKDPSGPSVELDGHNTTKSLSAEQIVCIWVNTLANNGTTFGVAGFVESSLLIRVRPNDITVVALGLV